LLPNFGPLEIDEKTERSARSSQIVETLRGLFVSKALDTLQFDYQYVVDENVSEVFSDAVGPCTSP
jgi:hypothetical protein